MKTLVKRLHQYMGAMLPVLTSGLVAGQIVLMAAGQASAADKVIVAMPTTDPAHAAAFIAEEAGFFKDENLEVELSFAIATQVARLVGGQADFAIGSLGGLLSPIGGGKSVVAIYGAQGGGLGGIVAALPNINSIRDCKQMAVLNPSTGMGWVGVYKKVFNASYEIAPKTGEMSSLGTMLGAGLIDCAMASEGTFAAYVASGKAKFLINPITDRASLPPELKVIAEVGVVGLPEHLAERKDVVVRFLRAYHRAALAIKSGNADELAALVKRNPNAASFSLDAIKAGIRTTKVAQAPIGGDIPKADWTFTLQWLKDSGMSAIDASAPQWQYEKVVDMSYFQLSQKAK